LAYIISAVFVAVFVFSLSLSHFYG